MLRPRLIPILLCALVLNAYHAISLAAQNPAAASVDSANHRAAARLVGAWRLVKFETWRTATGERIDSESSDHVPGMLMYDARGYMSAQVDQRSFTAGLSAGLYIAYFGPFTVDARAGTVTHHLQSASARFKAGDENVRQYRFEDADRRLVLTPPPQADGTSSRLTWERLR
jgi:hypothetical protein